jgi:hypothetical protein
MKCLARFSSDQTRRRIAALAVAACSLLFTNAVSAEQSPLKLPPASRSMQTTPATLGAEGQSAARMWIEAALEAIRRDQPRVTVHVRNLYHLSAAMYDAWAAYSIHDETVFHQEQAQAGPSLKHDRVTAISHAAYGVLSHRFTLSPGHLASQAHFDGLMHTLGLDPDNTTIVGDSAAAVGNRVAASVIELNMDDGANESGNYRDATGYNPVNLAMFVAFPGTGGLSDPNAWQPLITPGGATPQGFLTPHWYAVRPFALQREQPDQLYLDAGSYPRFGGIEHELLVADLIELIESSSWLDPDDGTRINISPAELGNNPLGSNAGTGHDVNPVTGEKYLPNQVLQGDWARVVAEFWADGPNSSTPPGHWNEIANQVNDRLDDNGLRIGGVGEPVDRLEWDVKLYLVLNGALHDAGIASWENKYVYNSSRPITLVRYLSELGQSSDPSAPFFHPLGLPLIDGLIELITAQSSASGSRHAHLADYVGEIAIRAWRGYPDDPDVQHGGSGWIRGAEWLPYQAGNFITPAFPGYVSGHSTFSRAAAQVLTLMTGDPFFPGGLAEFEMAPDGYSLNFEYGPSELVRLQWASYYDAADEAGWSRILGGIHPQFDDFPGRRIGHEVGALAFAQAMEYFAQPALGADPVNVPTFSRSSVGVLVFLTFALGMYGIHSPRRQQSC